MSTKDQPPPEDTPAQEPAAQPEPPRRREGPDAFQGPGGKKPAFELLPQRNEPGSGPMPRKRMLDPRLVPLVPPGVTTDPARQFHALLGLPKPAAKPAEPARPVPAPQAKPKPAPKPKPVKAKPAPAPAPPERKGPPPAPEPIEKILVTLPPARASIIRQVLGGPENRLKRALRAFLEDARFQGMDFESQRRALAAFDLRY